MYQVWYNMRMKHKDVIFGKNWYWRICKYKHGDLVFVKYYSDVKGEEGIYHYQFFVYYTDYKEEMWGH